MRGLTILALALACSAGGAFADPGESRLVTVSGFVVDETLAPVAGAEVMVSRFVLDEGGASARVFQTHTTDARGRFTVSLPADSLGYLFFWQAVCLWALAPGADVGFLRLNAYTPPAGREVRMVLRRHDPSASTLEILGPDGEPVANAVLRPTAHSEGTHVIPEELAQRLEVVSDAEGRAHLSCFSIRDVERVRVTSERDGEQLILRSEPASPRLQLSGVGTLKGRVVTEGDEKVAGLIVTANVSSGASASGRGPRFVGSATTVTDTDGRFVLEKLVQGKARISIGDDDAVSSTVSILGESADAEVMEGAVTEIEVKVERRAKVTVSGRVIEAGSRRPLEGAVLFLTEEYPAGRRVVSDENGEFSCRLPSGKVSVNLFRPPPGHLGTSVVSERGLEVAEGADSVRLEVELAACPSVRGRVVDTMGGPVSGAWVRAMTRQENGFEVTGLGVCDENGGFRVGGLVPGAKVELVAHFGDATSGEPVVRPASGADEPGEPVTLTLDLSTAPTVGGLVVDEGGQLLPGATVKIWLRRRTKEGFERIEPAYRQERDFFLLTGADGRYASERRLPEADELCAVAVLEGRIPARTPWVRPEGEATRLTDLVLEPVRTLRGRVLDAKGRPVENALLFQSGDGPRRTETRSGRDGAFALPGYAGGRGFVFLEAAGHRLEGRAVSLPARPLADGADALVLRLLGEDASSAAAPPPLTPAQERALARRVYLTWFEGVEERMPASRFWSSLGLLARVDPEGAMERIERRGQEPGARKDYVLPGLALRLAPEDLAEALAVAASIEDAYTRCYTYLRLFLSLPEDSVHRPAMLSRALVESRGIAQPSHRLICQGRLAEELLVLGNEVTAREIFREVLVTARELAPSEYEGYARGVFAESLAHVDPEAALALIADLSDPFAIQRHHGNLAHEMAAIDPGLAERAFEKVTQDFQRDRWTAKVVYRMARVDPERAFRLAHEVSDLRRRARTLGVLAQALAESHPERAREALHEAISLLEEQSPLDQYCGLGNPGAAELLASLLPVVERVSPEEKRAVLLRAITLRYPRPHPDHLADESSPLARDAMLAALLACHDREVARELLVDLTRRLEEDPAARGFPHRAFFAAATLIDPARACELLESIPEEGDFRPDAPRLEAVKTITEILTTSPEERPQWCEKTLLWLWTIDSEDHFE
jgi:protocatechuate 3,4-dioxygenase beta subunit